MHWIPNLPTSASPRPVVAAWPALSRCAAAAVMLLMVASLASAPAVAQTQAGAASAAAPEPEAPPLGGGGRPVGADYSRSPVYGARGMAATAQPLASQVAVDVLKQGGSPVDAAIAANAALGLMEPTGNGIGGDLFAIVWDPASGMLYGYNGSGRSPRGRTREALLDEIARLKSEGKLDEDAQGIPALGSLPVTVPGTVDAWFALHEQFGRLPMSRVLAPAVDYAREGFPVSPVIASGFAANLRAFNRSAALIEEFDNAQAIWFKGGRAPAVGEIFRNPALGDTLERIGEEGRDVFYRGELAQIMAAYFQRLGADLALEDFAGHRGEWVTPGTVNYRGYDIYELPPNGQGYAALQMLNMLKHVDFRKLPRSSAEVFHYMVEAKRLAFEDIAAYYADPDFSQIPMQGLLSEEYGRRRFEEIDPKRANPDVGPGEPLLEGEGDTTYLTVADASGMMVSLIQSNYRGMGSGLAPDGLGFMFQDRGELFSLDPSHPNAYAPGKRPFHTIIPAFVMKDGKPYMSFGLMGGGMQPQGHVQVLINHIDYGMNVQQAGDAARFMHDGGRQPTGVHKDPVGTLYLEPGVPELTRERLRALGHKIVVDGDGWRFGGYQAIIRQGDTYIGATEMRKDGTVVAY
ncbi:MAG: gamma-glutamyltransferase family protein [Halieaceae bacterium]|nr:gamma-glutamyltransferase family protein [Halieaceae bacterium]